MRLCRWIVGVRLGCTSACSTVWKGRDLCVNGELVVGTNGNDADVVDPAEHSPVPPVGPLDPRERAVVYVSPILKAGQHY